MNRSSWIGIRSVLALMGSALTLMVEGCRSIDQDFDEKSSRASAARVLSTNSVPFELEDDHVMIRGTLNGHEVRLALDTGANLMVVSPEAAAAAGIRSTTKIKFSAFGDRRGSARMGVIDSVAIGPAVAEKVPVAIMPMPSLLQGDGLVELSFLKQFNFRLDYDRKSVSFAPRASTNLAAGGSSVPMQQGTPMLVVQAEVDGIPAKLMVDTGGGQALILRSWFVEKHKLRERYPKRLSLITGVGLLGQMRGEIARLQTLKLGGFTVTNVFAEFEKKARTWPGDFAGFVGGPFLRQFNITFDAAGHRLWIDPNSSYDKGASPPASVRSGLVCLPEGTNWIVLDILADSPAAEAGVRRGDRLLEINGVPVSSLKPAEIRRAFRAEPGTRVRLRIQSGDEAVREVYLQLRDLL
jgi:predicted aspartyl protease